MVAFGMPETKKSGKVQQLREDRVVQRDRANRLDDRQAFLEQNGKPPPAPRVIDADRKAPSPGPAPSNDLRDKDGNPITRPKGPPK